MNFVSGAATNTPVVTFFDNLLAVPTSALPNEAPTAAFTAREMYACFTPWERDPATYGRAAASGGLANCEHQALTTLRSLLEE